MPDNAERRILGHQIKTARRISELIKSRKPKKAAKLLEDLISESLITKFKESIERLIQRKEKKKSDISMEIETMPPEAVILPIVTSDTTEEIAVENEDIYIEPKTATEDLVLKKLGDDYKRYPIHVMEALFAIASSGWVLKEKKGSRLWGGRTELLILAEVLKAEGKFVPTSTIAKNTNLNERSLDLPIKFIKRSLLDKTPWKLSGKLADGELCITRSEASVDEEKVS